MKIVFLIYGISWTILLLVYVISLIQAHHGKSPISNNEWYYIVLLLLFAPLVVLVIPFILISDHKKDKQNKKLQQEREKKERELEARTNTALGIFNRAELVDNESLMADCVSVAHNLMNIVDKKRYEEVFGLLDCISLPEGASFGIKVADWDFHTSKLYVSFVSGEKDNDVFKYLIVKETPMGAWQACLLYKLWYSLPLFDHAGYDRRTYIVHPSDILNVYEFDESRTNNIRKILMNRGTKQPHIYHKGNKYYIEQHYWNNWSGLVREIVEVSFENKRVSFLDVESTVEVKYNCGVFY